MSLPLNRQTSESAWLQIVQQQVESLRFGVVQIVVHEGGVVQIERTEKFRLAGSVTESSEKNLPYRNSGGSKPQHE